MGRGLVGRGSWVVGRGSCVVRGSWVPHVWSWVPHIYTSCMHNFTLFPMPSHNSAFVRDLFLACTLSDSDCAKDVTLTFCQWFTFY